MSLQIISNPIPLATIETYIESLRYKGRGVFRKKPVEKLSYIRSLLWPVRHFEISYTRKGKTPNVSVVRNFMLGNFSLTYLDNILRNDGGRPAFKLVFSRENQAVLRELVRLRNSLPTLPVFDPDDVYHQLYKFYSDHRSFLENQLDQTVREMEPLYAEVADYEKKLFSIRERFSSFDGDKEAPDFRELRSLRSDFQKKIRQLNRQANTAISKRESALQIYIRKWNRGLRRFLGISKNMEIVNIGVIGTFYYQYWVARLDSSSSTRYLVIDKHNAQVRNIQNMLNYDARLREVLDTTLQFKKFSGDANCIYCGTPIGKADAKCSNCSKEVLKCSVCKLSISYGDQVAGCPKCGSQAHLSHLYEWIKTQGKCPVCMRDIKLRNLVVSDDEN